MRPAEALARSVMSDALQRVTDGKEVRSRIFYLSPSGDKHVAIWLDLDKRSTDVEKFMQIMYSFGDLLSSSAIMVLSDTPTFIGKPGDVPPDGIPTTRTLSVMYRERGEEQRIIICPYEVLDGKPQFGDAMEGAARGDMEIIFRD